MKIAFFDIYKRIPISSGGDWWMFQLLKDLARNNTVSAFYTTEKSSQEGYIPKDISFTSCFLPSRVEWNRLSTRLGLLRPDMLWDKRQLHDVEADCVFTLIYGYHLATYIARKNDAPLVLVMQNIEWEYVKSMGSLWYLPFRILENWILDRVDAVVTISAHDYDYVIKHASSRPFCIPPKPDADVFNPDGARFDYGDRFNVVFFGSLDRPQNRAALTFIVKELVPALARERSDGAFSVNVFGSGEASEGSFKGTGINFIGAVSDPGLFIRGADAIIIPIRNASGIKLRAVESLACGKPVVATPEAVQGLPKELRAMMYVANTAEEFVEVLNGLRNGRLINMTDPSAVLRHMCGDAIDDVINYALKDKRKRTVVQQQ